MATPWDESFKLLLSEHPQDFVTLVMPGAQFQGKLLTEFAGRKATADGLFEIIVEGKPMLLQIEVQSTNDPQMPERMLDYALRAKRDHQRDVSSCVFYLREQGEVPPSPLQWPPINGHPRLTFHYLVLEVYKLQPQEVRQWGLPGLLPLLLLTKGGATHEMAEEVVTGLEAMGRQQTLPAVEILLSLVFRDEADKAWLKRRFGTMYESLKESWLVQELMEEVREEAERKLQEGERKLQEVRKEAELKLQEVDLKLKALQREVELRAYEAAVMSERLEDQRQNLLSFVSLRFPAIVAEAVRQAYAIKELAILRSLLTQLFTAETPEEALQMLRNWKTNAEQHET
jgi:predicted transposase YdaD